MGDAVSDMLMVEAILIHKKVVHVVCSDRYIYKSFEGLGCIVQPHIQSNSDSVVPLGLCTPLPLLSPQWSCEDWIRMYKDLPNRQLKVKASL